MKSKWMYTVSIYKMSHTLSKKRTCREMQGWALNDDKVIVEEDMVIIVEN